MSTDIEKSIKQSSLAFEKYVWPMIKESIGGGEIMAVEGVYDNDMAKKLDTISGIDIWQIVDNQKGIRGIANRIQPTGRSWDTFTVRRSLKSGNETEYHKRIRALMHPELGYLYPQITIQAYMNKGYNPPILSAGLIRTKDLFDALIQNITSCEVKTVEGGNTMFVVKWGDLINLGYNVKIFRGE